MDEKMNAECCMDERRKEREVCKDERRIRREIGRGKREQGMGMKVSRVNLPLQTHRNMHRLNTYIHKHTYKQLAYKQANTQTGKRSRQEHRKRKS